MHHGKLLVQILIHSKFLNTVSSLEITGQDRSTENVHPDIFYDSNGFRGYPYWMVMTPYPKGNDKFENPSLRASFDGVNWYKVPEVPDPVISTPEDPNEHHSDPDIVVHNGSFYLFFRTTNKKTKRSIISVTISGDAISWSKPEIIIDNKYAVSPSVIVEDNCWKLWYIDYNPLRKKDCSELILLSGESPYKLYKKQKCLLKIENFIPWHLDVVKTDNQYETFIAAFPSSLDSSLTSLFHAFSENGITFRLSSDTPVLRPSIFGWDNRMIYRSTFNKNIDGTYNIWYSASSWGEHYGIGFISGNLNKLKSDNQIIVILKSIISFKKIMEDIFGMIKYFLLRYSPNILLEKLYWFRRKFPHN